LRPGKVFSRTCFTRAFKDRVGMVLQRLSSKTDGAASVLTLITQFGGGKTHTLTSVDHLAKTTASGQTGDFNLDSFSVSFMFSE
jgi:predicted AAA+ superfamily ATPase